jgi:hypothetical protein
LFVPLCKGGDLLFDLPEGADPQIEDALPRIGQDIDPLGGTGGFVVPARGDEALALEGAEDAIEVPHVDSIARHECLELIEQLVAVARVVA